MIGEFQGRLREAWSMSDRIFDVVPREGWLDQPISIRHPILFYIGHLPAFAWNQVGCGLLDLGHFRADFDDLFERGIDPVGIDAYDSVVNWPAVDDVLEYRDLVRERLLDLVAEVLNRGGDHPLAERGRILNVVLEHEYMHQETLQYMLLQIDPEAKIRPEGFRPYDFGPGGKNIAVDIEGGGVDLGADFDTIDFGWDNEFPTHRVTVDGFTIDSLPVRNADWLEFITAGCYRNEQLWSAGEWEWRARNRVEHPAAWEPADGGWRFRTMFDRLDLEQAAGWPVMVSLAEARAWCRWRGVRLPTEAALHRAMYGAPNGAARVYPWGDDPPEPGVHGNFSFDRWSPAPAGSHPAGTSAWGVEDTVGDAWEWTSSPFAPFPGFSAYIPSYSGYSADFFDDAHFVMIGASWATPKPLIRRSFRNWFQDQYQYAFAGFRTVRKS